MKNNRVQKKVVLITGASSGIGKALAQVFAQENFVLVLVGRNTVKLTQVKRLLPQNTPIYTVGVDITTKKGLATIKQLIAKNLGSLDILIHCAGELRIGKTTELSLKDLDFMYEINTKAPLALTRLLLPFLKQQKGQIVFINSSVNTNITATNGLYAATKAALKSIADSLRAEVNDNGIRVVSVYPGRTATPMQERLLQQEHKPFNKDALIDPLELAQIIAQIMAIQKSAEVTDLYLRPVRKVV